MKSPAAYKRLQLELDQAVVQGNLSSPVKYAQAIELPFLNACIKEGMRLHPSVGLAMPRHAPAEGLNLGGHFIPAGYRVGVNAAVVHRDPAVFGPKPDEFIPERWLEGDSKNMDRYMVHFGAGTRTCIGKNVSCQFASLTRDLTALQISISEIYKLIPLVLMHFEVQLVDPSSEWVTNGMWFNKQTGIIVKMTRRPESSLT